MRSSGWSITTSVTTVTVAQYAMARSACATVRPTSRRTARTVSPVPRLLGAGCPSVMPVTLPAHAARTLQAACARAVRGRAADAWSPGAPLGARRVQAVRRLGQQALEHRVPVQRPQQRVVVVPAAGVVDGVVRLAGGGRELEPGGAGDLAADPRLGLRRDPGGADRRRSCPRPPSCCPCCPHAARHHPHGCDDTRWHYPQRARRRRPRTFRAPNCATAPCSSAFLASFLSLPTGPWQRVHAGRRLRFPSGLYRGRRSDGPRAEPLTSPCDGC